MASLGTEALDVPVFDLSKLCGKTSLEQFSEDDIAMCQGVSKCLHETGCLVVRHPRVLSTHNEQFLDTMERYFSQPAEAKMAEARPNLHYQVGVTPSGVERPRILVDTDLQDQAGTLHHENKATIPTGPDLKWRYMWRVGPRPERTAFAELNAEPVVPGGFPEWREVMDSWGERMLDVANTVAAAAAAGFGLPLDAFSSLMARGPHLLAPTGSDLEQHGRLGTVFAGYHYDLNFLTLHGRSRFPGLFVWLRDGRRVPVRVPEGCLFVQAGKQLEWLTGGYVQAGMHEVLVTESTLKAVQDARAAGRCLWRVSSTVFSHIQSDQVLQPTGSFATAEALRTYRPIRAGEQVQQELEAISLRKAAAAAGAAAGAGAKGEQETRQQCDLAHSDTAAAIM
eukprot:CAMPEP_0202898288 /NCGR_PEP_ID=MMETSP1392-20130828/6838_1 /ASSEMBLY_ACC=CAM_ASM_000868 /TAXON_ID=225041 /ORGANISM="Chlamydomonas chlamydogama, Strain SAG 11-48b" /LENGTH=394 /DNA_ID=CAMNT_0049584163 /DNA_START=103 /DNA_END=1287 /DNA_ORIENTATION=-